MLPSLIGTTPESVTLSTSRRRRSSSAYSRSIGQPNTLVVERRVSKHPTLTTRLPSCSGTAVVAGRERRAEHLREVGDAALGRPASELGVLEHHRRGLDLGQGDRRLARAVRSPTPGAAPSHRPPLRRWPPASSPARALAALACGPVARRARRPWRARAASRKRTPPRPGGHRRAQSRRPPESRPLSAHRADATPPPARAAGIPERCWIGRPEGERRRRRGRVARAVSERYPFGTSLRMRPLALSVSR